MKRTLSLYVAWLVATVILVFAVTGRHPYGFYTLLRWICCAAFAYSAFTAHEKNRVAWVWVFGVLAMLFNPIVPLHFQRDPWQMIDWVTICVIVVAGIVFWPSEMFNQQFHFKISSTKNNALYDQVAEEPELFSGPVLFVARLGARVSGKSISFSVRERARCHALL